MSMLQLNPYIPLFTPLGYAEAHAMSDLGDDCNPLYYCFVKGVVVTFDGTEVRRIRNLTLDSTEFIPFPPEVMKKWSKMRKWLKIK